MHDPPTEFAIECRYENGATEIFLVDSRQLDLLQFGWMFAAVAGPARDIRIRPAVAADRLRAARRPERALRAVA